MIGVRRVLAMALFAGGLAACSPAPQRDGDGTGASPRAATPERLRPWVRSERAERKAGDADGRSGASARAPGERPATAALDSSGFRLARGTREWRFPRDHAAHSEYATEWWYTTGILRAGDGRRFGYELTFFRVGLARAAEMAEAARERSPWRARDLLLAHAAVTDVSGRRFVVEKRLERAAHGWAGADTLRMDVWIGGWRASEEGGEFALRLPADSTGGRLGLDLRLRSARPPVLHGREGLSPKDGRPQPHASWYLSLPRLKTAGSLTVGGETFDVSGLAWMDHEFFSGGLAPGQEGWDWFSCRLEDGRDLMLYRMRGAGGRTDYVSGTVTSPDGRGWRPVDLRGVVFKPLERWMSPATGAAYPIAWLVHLPAEDLELRSRTPLPAQELAAGSGGAFAYWEGLVDYSGAWAGKEIRGEGYIELTGYDRPIQLP